MQHVLSFTDKSICLVFRRKLCMEVVCEEKEDELALRAG